MSHSPINFPSFYRTSLGHMTRKLLRGKIREAWPSTEGKTVMGLGFPIPYLMPFLQESERVVGFTAPTHHIRPWPKNRKCLVGMAHMDSLPVADDFADCILLVHHLEHAKNTTEVLREVWRTLKPEGRLLIVLPYRRGIWSRTESTPFGHGHPYTQTQAKNLLEGNLFTPLTVRRSLFVPPTNLRFVHAMGRTFEKIFRYCFLRFSGVLVIEAKKEVFGGTLTGEVASHRKKTFAGVVSLQKGMRPNSQVKKNGKAS